MGQLHEVLAVENELKNIAKKTIEEGMVTFSKKPGNFTGIQKTLKMFNDARSNEEAAAQQSQEMVTTVSAKLEYVIKSAVRALDATAQKEKTNQLAKADVIINDMAILKNVPATLLLTLEKELVVYRNLYSSIPTLQPGVEWIADKDQGAGIYRAAKVDIKSKTEKTRLHKEISPATREHKAQIETWTEDRPVGSYETTHICSMITPARKSDLLGKIDSLIQAVKKARTRANKEEIVDVHVGQIIFDYINA